MILKFIIFKILKNTVRVLVIVLFTAKRKDGNQQFLYIAWFYTEGPSASRAVHRVQPLPHSNFVKKKQKIQVPRANSYDLGASSDRRSAWINHTWVGDHVRYV